MAGTASYLTIASSIFRYIPVICGAAGLVLSVAASLLISAYASTDLLEAAAIGIVSGLAATGANQVAKQAKK